MCSRMAMAAVPLLGLMSLGATQAPAQCSFDSSVPDNGEVVEVLPRNASGKVLKHELRAKYAD